jgi:hypothetical protein
MAETPAIDPMQALAAIMKQLTTEQGNNFMEAIKELKKPSEREQRKLDEDDARVARAQKECLELAKADVTRREMNARGCGHVRTHPGTGVTKHLWRAQVHTPAGKQPYFMPTCQGCQTQIGPIPATADMLREGVNLDQYPGITAEALKTWAEQYRA